MTRLLVPDRPCAACSTAAFWMSAMTTLAPASASAVAMPRPMPEAAPVTMAVLPEMSMGRGPFGLLGHQPIPRAAPGLWREAMIGLWSGDQEGKGRTDGRGEARTQSAAVDDRPLQPLS